MDFLTYLNEKIIWGPVLVALFLGTGIFLSIRTGFFQLFHFGRIFREFCYGFKGKKGKRKKGELSPLEALSTALAGTLGVGNIAGVATALVAGGPGAIFWMWISSFFGMATKYAEIVLACRYRERREGKTVGGPMYYLEKGLHSPFLAAVFSVCCICAAVFGVGGMTQANTISGALLYSFQIPPVVTGAGLAILTGVVLLGGVSRIGKVTSLLVPLMAVFYTGGALYVIFLNRAYLPQAFQSIFEGAFGVQAFSGGVLGSGLSAALRVGLSRGVFTNEAGLGSATMAHAASSQNDPVRQGFSGVAEVFVDTMVMCSITALAILCSGVMDGKTDGIALTTRAFETALGTGGGAFLSISTTLFAFCSILGWSYYGEQCAVYLSGGRKSTKAYKIFFLSALFLGSTLGLSAVWATADIANGLMAVPNLIGVLALSGQVAALTKAYFKDKLRK